MIINNQIHHALGLALCIAAASSGLAAAAVATEDPARYPSKSIRFVVPFPPGGGNDTIARMVGQQMAASLGQQVAIDNRPGAAGDFPRRREQPWPQSEPDQETVVRPDQGF